MYTGWWRPFDVRRPLSADERGRALAREGTGGRSDDRQSLIRFNSTCLDMIDRRFRLRGMVATTFVALFSGALALAGVGLLAFWVPTVFEGRPVDWFLVLAIAVLFVGQAFFFWRLSLRKDFFTYTHYPIRFNRKTRMIHVFRHNGRDGVDSVPWDEAWFHIGVGHYQDYLRDLRFHVMRGDEVLATHAVGHYFDSDETIREIWEFVRRYMEVGPDAVVDDPERRRIGLAPVGDWKNCYMWVVASMGVAAHKWRHLLLPLILPLMTCRWLVFKSCRVPKWPERIELESKVEAGDPHVWQEPAYLGEFYAGRGV